METYSANWSAMPRAGTGMLPSPRRLPMSAWMSGPRVPREAKLPTARPAMALNRRGSSCCRRSWWRSSSSIQTAALNPKVMGTACWLWVRPAMTKCAPLRARPAAAERTPPSWCRMIPWACLSWRRSPVWVMFWVVAPQWTHPPCGCPTASLSSVTRAMSGWLVASMPRTMAAASSSASVAFAVMAAAASAGTSPWWACAWARAASVLSQLSQRASRVKRRRMPGSGTRESVNRAGGAGEESGLSVWVTSRILR